MNGPEGALSALIDPERKDYPPFHDTITYCCICSFIQTWDRYRASGSGETSRYPETLKPCLGRAVPESPPLKAAIRPHAG